MRLRIVWSRLLITGGWGAVADGTRSKSLSTPTSLVAQRSIHSSPPPPLTAYHPLYTISPSAGAGGAPPLGRWGGGPAREVGTSSCWAPPPSPAPAWLAAPLRGLHGGSRQQHAGATMCGWRRGQCAMEHGSLGCAPPGAPSHHCDAQGAQPQGVKGLGPEAELAWPPRKSDLISDSRDYRGVCVPVHVRCGLWGENRTAVLGQATAV